MLICSILRIFNPFVAVKSNDRYPALQLKKSYFTCENYLEQMEFEGVQTTTL